MPWGTSLPSLIHSPVTETFLACVLSFPFRKRHAAAVPVYGGSQELVAVLGASLAERELPEKEGQEEVGRVAEAAAEMQKVPAQVWKGQ